MRRPPRGIPKSEIAARHFYDIWLPVIAPSQELVTFARRSHDPQAWKTFARRYRAEMKRPEPSRILDLLAALSRHTNLSIGCYCEDERRCHRFILEELLAERGAALM